MTHSKYIAAMLTTLATVLLSFSAAASELLPQQHYADQLQRCVAAIRAELVVDGDTPLQHRVTDISKENIWYEFAIATVLDGETNGQEQVIAETQCRAWRFNEQTMAAVEINPANTAILASLR